MHLILIEGLTYVAQALPDLRVRSDRLETPEFSVI